MKRSIKSKLLTILTILFTFACLSAVATFGAFAAPTTFTTYGGPSIRVVEPLGIRFVATISEQEYDELLTTYGQENVEIGMKIARCETVEELKLFPNEGTLFPVSTLNSQDGNYVISKAITNISAEQYNSYFTALGYIKVTDGESETFYYADYTDGVNSRTPLQVAVVHKTVAGDDMSDDAATFINGIIDSVFAQGGMLFDKAQYTLAKNASIVPEVSVQGVEIETILTSENESVAKIVDGAIVAVGEGSTKITATIIGETKSYTCTANVVVSADDIAIALENGVISISGDATAVSVDGADVDLESGATEFDLAGYLKKNGYEEKEYIAYAKKDGAQSASVSLEMKNVDNADELLAISEGSANTYYVVTDNISLAGKEVSTFGTGRAFIESLTGVLDVNGYAISSISYVEPDNTARYKGLIAVVEQTGVVKNGYFIGATTVYHDGRSFLIGKLDGLIDNCYVDVKKFSLINTGGNYYATHGVIYEVYGTVKNLIVNFNSCNAGLPIIAYANAQTRVENVISISNNEKTSGLHVYRLAGANSYKYLGFDKNNTYLYNGMNALFNHSGKILKHNETEFVFSNTVKVPYLNFAPVFDFDEQAGKIYMVNDKYGKMEMSVEVNIAQEELDVVKDKYSPQISVTLSGIYGSDVLTYKSSKTSVATVDENGVVTYAGNGTATITVTHTESGATATVPVNTYDTYIGITDLATFVTIEGATQYTYAELLSDIEIKDSDLSSYKVSLVWIPNTGNVYASSLVSSFGGTLNGNGKKISTVMDKTVTSFTTNIDGTDQTTTNFALLFCNIKSTAVLKNTIIDAHITTYAAESSGRTSIIHYGDGMVKDCYIKVFYFGTKGLGQHQIVRYCRGMSFTNCIIEASGYTGSASNGLKTINIATSRITHGGRSYSMKNVMLVHDALGESGYSHSNGVYAGANVSSYKNYANILTGAGISYSLNDDSTALVYTALIAPQYNSFSSAWSFGADGIKLCGTAIYTPAN